MKFLRLLPLLYGAIFLLFLTTAASNVNAQTTTAAAGPTSNTSKPAIIWPSSIVFSDLDDDDSVTGPVQVSLQFTAAQYRTWLSTATIELAGAAPLYEQPFGLQATFSGAVPAERIKLVNDVTLNITIPPNKCFAPNADDTLLIRFGASTAAVRIRNMNTLETVDVNGDQVPESSTAVTVESMDETRTAGLGVIAFTFSLICLLFLLSDWTQATVSCLQLQWVVMISMQTCVPLDTSGIFQNSHWLLWPLNSRLEPSNPEYAFRMLFNMLLMLFVLVLELLMIAAFAFFGKDRVTAMQRVRFPSTLGVALALLLPSGCMFASTQVFSLLDAGAAVAGGPQVTYAVVSLLLAVIYIALVCVATFTIVSRLVYRDLQPRASRTWFARLTSPDGEWLVEDAVSARWGLLFDSYSVRGFWVFAALQVVTFLFAVASGPVPTSRTGCSAKAYANIVTAVVLAALHVVRKPFSTAMSNLTNTVVALAIVVLCVANASANSDSCSGKSRIFSSACAWGALLVVCVKVLVHCVLTAFTSVNAFLFAAEQRAAAAAAAGAYGGGGADEEGINDSQLAGRLITPFGGDGGGGGVDKSISLDAQDAFELKLFHGHDAVDTSGGGDGGSGAISHLVGVAAGGAGGEDPAGAAAYPQQSVTVRSVGLSPSSSPARSAAAAAAGGGGGGTAVTIAGLRPVLANPVMVSGAFLRREVGFGKMGGLRGETGPSLVIQLYAPVCCTVTASGVVIVVEAGFRGTALGRHAAGSASPTNSTGGGSHSLSRRGGSVGVIPKDAKPRILAHATDTRRTEAIQLRDASYLRDAFLGGGRGGGGSRARASSTGGGGGGDGDTDSPPKRSSNHQQLSSNSFSATGGGPKNPLKLPSACCAGQNCIFVCDADEGCVIRVDPVSGLVSTVIADLLKPSGVAVFGDILYVSDTLRHRVLAVDLLAGKVSVFAGTGSAGFDADGTSAGQSRLNCPQGLCVCSDTADLFIADSCNHRVVCVSLSLRTVRTVIGIPGVLPDDNNGMELQPAREVALAMPTQVVARVSPEAQRLDASALAVEIFVIESGASRIWHVSRFGFAHVVIPPNDFVVPHSMCIAPEPSKFQRSARAFVSPATHKEDSSFADNDSYLMAQHYSSSSALYSPHANSSVELLVVDTALQIVARVSVPSLQPPAMRERTVPPEFQFAPLPPPRARQQQQQQQSSVVEPTQDDVSRVNGVPMLASLSEAVSPILHQQQQPPLREYHLQPPQERQQRQQFSHHHERQQDQKERPRVVPATVTDEVDEF